MAQGKTERDAASETGPVRLRLQDLELAVSDKGMAGAQASIYRLAVDAANIALPLLERLEVVTTDSSARDVVALKTVIRSEFAELVGELALAQGPNARRVEHIFSLLLDQLGALNDGIEDEDSLTSFQTVADCVASLFRSWNNAQQVFAAGTGIVLKQFQLVLDAAEEVRFTMDAVFIGPEERSGMTIRFAARAGEPQAVSLEELLGLVHTFATSDGPDAIAQAGGFALRNSVFPNAKKLGRLAGAAMDPRNLETFPKRCSAPPLMRAMRNLEARLDELAWNC